MIGRWEPLAHVLDCQVELSGKNQYGVVKSGRIDIEASLIPVVLVDSRKNLLDTCGDLPLYPKHLHFRTIGGAEKLGSGLLWPF